MATINEFKRRNLSSLGYTGSLNDMWLSFLRAMTGKTTGDVNDLEKFYLGGSNSILDRWKSFLVLNGVTRKDLNDALKVFWSSIGAGALTVKNQFAANEVGVWYDPSDFSTLFQDSSGTTPVTAIGQVVGLMLDKSKGLVLGPELVTNGTFDTSTGWALTNATISGGTLNLSPSATASIGATLTAGLLYKVTYTITANSPGSSGIRVYVGSTGVGVLRTTTGTFTEYTTCSGALNIYLFTGAGFVSGSVDNLSVKLVSGYHATQATSTARPIIGRHPITGRRNLLTYTEDFSNAAWIKTAGGTGITPTVTNNAGVAPDGTLTACRLVATVNTAASGDNYSLIQQGTGAIVQRAGKVYIKSNTGVNQSLYFRAGGTAGAVTVTPTWQAFESIGSVADYFSIGYRAVAVPSNTTVDVLIWHPQQEENTANGTYQKVVSTYDVTEAGVNDAYYLKFDGVDDFLVTPSIDFSGTDKMSVFAGVRKLSDAASGMVAELSVTAAANAGTFNIVNGAAAGAGPYWRGVSNGTTLVGVESSGFASPITNVLTFTGNISAPLAELRANGSVIATSASTQGIGNYGNYPLYIGMRAGTSLPFNGHLYSLVVRGALSDASQIAATENYINNKTGAY